MRSDKIEEVDFDVLPVIDYKEEILDKVNRNQIVIIIGETGSGKTTQIPQFFLDSKEYLNNQQCIGITQPRKIAAITVAQRVSDERKCRIGDEVGYTVRFDDCTTSRTKLKFMTDGILVREVLSDMYLSKYDIIMLDEAHERSLNTDILFGLIKATCRLRPALKLIITSATLDSEKFGQYFNNCPVIRVPGRIFPVDIYHSKMKQIMTATGINNILYIHSLFVSFIPNLVSEGPSSNSSYVQAAVDIILKIHQKDTEGHILVFLTGQEEIEKACHLLREALKTQTKDSNPALLNKELIILPLYAALSSETQAKVFKKPSLLIPYNNNNISLHSKDPTTKKLLRKCVIATNIAETSITVPQVKFVIDTGYVKQKTYDPLRGMESLIVVPVSKIASLQRAGRAGRTGPGQCYRLYSSECFDNMMDETIPEIKRTNLANTVLYLKALGIHDILGFDFLDAPSEDQIMQALSQLHTLDAIDDQGVITPLGRKMSSFPLEPHLARVLIEAHEYDCIEEVTTICAMLSSESIYITPSNPNNSNGKNNKPNSKDANSQNNQPSNNRIQLKTNTNYFFNTNINTGSHSLHQPNDFILAEKAHELLRHSYGDFHTYLNIYNQWEEAGFTSNWCEKYFINFRSMKAVRNIREHLLRDAIKILSKNSSTTMKHHTLTDEKYKIEMDSKTLKQGQGVMKFDGMEASSSLSLDKRISIAFTAGFYMNSSIRCINESVYKSLSLLDIQRQNNNQKILDIRMVHIHPSSALSSLPCPEYLIYQELVHSNKLYMKQICKADVKYMKQLQNNWKYINPYTLCGREVIKDDIISVDNQLTISTTASESIPVNRINNNTGGNDKTNVNNKDQNYSILSSNMISTITTTKSSTSIDDTSSTIIGTKRPNIDISSSSSTTCINNDNNNAAMLAKQRYLERKAKK